MLGLFSWSQSDAPGRGTVVAMVFAAGLLSWFATGRALGQLDSPAGISGLQNAIERYQQALEMDDGESRLALFRDCKTEFAHVFRQARDQGFDLSAEFFVAWGNAAIQAGDPGEAVFAYRMALRHDPFHRQARENLEYVRGQLPEWTQFREENDLAMNRLFFWTWWLDSNAIRIAASLGFAIACLLIALSIVCKSGILRILAVFPLVVWLVLMASLLFELQTDSSLEVVFIAEDTSARTADSRNSPPSFGAKIPAGTEAKVLEIRDEWTHVRFGDHKQGWVPNSAVRQIR